MEENLFSDVHDVAEEDDVGKYDTFISKIASLEGSKRFIHHENDSVINKNSVVADVLGGPITVDGLLDYLETDTRRDLVKSRKKLKNKNVRKSVPHLAEPLATPLERQVNRAVVYDQARKDVTVWETVIQSRRVAETVSFPRDKPNLRLATAEEYNINFQAKTPLELEVMRLLNGSKSMLKPNENLNEKERSVLDCMSLREAIERRNELTKYKMLQSYHENKLKRQKKIKSKTYRKIQRKQKESEKIKKMDLNRAINPEQFEVDREEKNERNRIHERASLKHRNSSKYLALQSKRAKYNNNKISKNIVNEQLLLHRELTAKSKTVSEEAEENIDDNTLDSVKEACVDVHNPWMNVSKMKEKLTLTEKVEEASNIEDFKKYWNDINEKKLKLSQVHEKKRRRKITAAKEQLELAAGEIDDLFAVGESMMKKSKIDGASIVKKKKKKKMPAVNKENSNQPKLKIGGESDCDINITDGLKISSHSILDEGVVGKACEERTVSSLNGIVEKEETVKTAYPSIPVCNANKVTHLHSLISDSNLIEFASDDDGDEGGNFRQAITEAFSQDDVLADFSVEKSALLESCKPKKIDLTLPGWGEWTGQGLTMSKRKRNRFMIKATTPPKRKDENRGHLILNDHKETAIQKHQVSDVPFPFSSVADFEASIRAPIGQTFVPRTAFKLHTKPRLSTLKGAIIEPMGVEELVKRGIKAK